jgi:hypothetical protein
MKAHLLTGMFLAASLGAGASVQAAALIFDDTNPDETITVRADGFDLLSLNGLPFQFGGPGHPATTVLDEAAGAITFSGTFAAPTTPDSTGSRTIYLLEPDLKTLSDILDVTWSYSGHVGSISGSFISDAEGSSLGPLPPAVPPSDVFVETGIPVVFGRDFINVEVRSDVPDWGSFWLLPLALSAMGYLKSRLQPQAT